MRKPISIAIPTASTRTVSSCREILATALLLGAFACGGGSSSDPFSTGPSIDPGEIRSIQIEASGFVFDARVAGREDAPLVLLLHGFPQSSYEWRAQLASLGSAGYYAVAPDLRGYSPGARPAPVEAYLMERLVDDVLGMADSLGSERFHLVGHDWGAAIAWQVGIRFPGRLRSLTAVSVPHPLAFAEALANDPDQRQRSTYIQFFQQPGAAEAAFLANDAALLRSIYGAGPASEGADEYVRLLTEPGALTAALNYYRTFGQGTLGVGPVPAEIATLYIWSTGDQALGRYGAERTAAYVEGPYRFVVIEGASHWLPEDAADEVTSALIEHLDAYSSSSR